MADKLPKDIEKRLRDAARAAAQKPSPPPPPLQEAPPEAKSAGPPGGVGEAKAAGPPGGVAEPAGIATDISLEGRGASGHDEPRVTPETLPAVADELRFFRFVARALWALALVAVVVALLVNLAFSSQQAGAPAGGSPGAGAAAAGPAASGAGGPVAGGSASSPGAALPKTAVSLLPSSIIGYETIARQAVPGSGGTAAEAVFATLSMTLELSLPIGEYARVEAAESPDAAAARAKQIAASFPVKQRQMTIHGGLTPAVSGYSPDEGAWAVIWTHGQFVVEVKSFYKDIVPAQKKDFLSRTGEPVVEAIDAFLRTGRQQNMTVGP